MSPKTMKLNQLPKNQKARIVDFEPCLADSIQDVLTKRMMEMGIVKGSEIKLLHEAPFGKDPIAIEIRDALLGLRREEAALIFVELI